MKRPLWQHWCWLFRPIWRTTASLLAVDWCAAHRKPTNVLTHSQWCTPNIREKPPNKMNLLTFLTKVNSMNLVNTLTAVDRRPSRYFSRLVQYSYFLWCDKLIFGWSFIAPMRKVQNCCFGEMSNDELDIARRLQGLNCSYIRPPEWDVSKEIRWSCGENKSDYAVQIWLQRVI